MADIIAVLILLVLIGCAVGYIVKAKKKRCKVHRLSRRRNLFRQREHAEKETGWPCDRRKTMKISGMTCAHCAMNVSQMLNQIDGVKADVNFASGKAKISYDRKVDDDVFKEYCGKDRISCNKYILTYSFGGSLWLMQSLY